MEDKWPELRLDEVADLIVDCPHSTPKWTDKGVVVLRSQYIRNGKLDLSSPSYTTEEDYRDRIKRAIPSAGDLVLTREAPMGEVCQIPEGLRCCLGQRMVLIRANRKCVDPSYLLFALQSPYVKNQISWNEGTGTTVSNIRIPNLKAFEIPSPPLEYQKAIAYILGTLDDKIELNRKMSSTLEAMAQALFKSWFVNFDPVVDNALAAGNPIPEEFQTRAEVRAALGDERKSLSKEIQRQFPSRFLFTEEVGWLPEGWSAVPLSKAINVNPKVILRKGTLAKYVDMKGLPIAGYLIDEINEKKYSGGAKFLNGDVLMARITPCLENGKTGIVDFLGEGEPGFGSTEFIVLRSKGRLKTPFIAALSREESFRRHCIANMVGSSGRQRVQNSCFDSYYVNLPMDTCVLDLYHELSFQYFEKFTLLRNEIRSLARIRDTLLPKLLSGELRVDEDLLNKAIAV